MVRENHKMVREMSGKSQGILWGLMAGHPVQSISSRSVAAHIHAIPAVLGLMGIFSATRY